MATRVVDKIPVVDDAKLAYTLQIPGPPVSNDARTLVVFVNGLRTSMSDWTGLMAELDYRTDRSIYFLSYDRWGCGMSDRLPLGRSTNDIATCALDLQLLLHNILARHSIAPDHTDLMLVGSSIGCCIIRLLLQEYYSTIPAVKSIILLDSYMSNPDYVSVFPPQRDGEPEPLTRTRDIIARIFAPNVGNPEGLDRSNAGILLPSPSEPKLPGDPEVVVVVHDSEFTADQMVEKLDIDKECYLKYVDSALVEYHKGLERLSPKSRRMVAVDSGHFIHLDRPDLVIREILQCLGQNKN